MKKSSPVLAPFALLALLTGACASTRTPAPAPAHAERAATADANEDEDTDGEVDAEDEAPAGAAASAADAAEDGPCPSGMVLVTTPEKKYCIDKYEASLVEVAPDGTEKPYPHNLPVDGHAVRAVSVPDVFPQGFISEVQANDACVASQKHLCNHVEWKTACMGPQKTKFPYGEDRKAGVCHDAGKSAVAAVFGTKALTDPVAPSIVAANSKSRLTSASAASAPSGKNAPPSDSKKAHVTVKGKAASTTRSRATTASASRDKRDGKKKGASEHKRSSATKVASHTGPLASVPKNRSTMPAKASTRPAAVQESVWNHLNDPALGKVEGALAKTGSHAECVNGFGAVDMVGNLHEWVATDPSAVHGTFAGGYYLDTSLNGDGCQYRTVAHAHDYHDYSTGFRCCADARDAR